MAQPSSGTSPRRLRQIAGRLALGVTFAGAPALLSGCAETDSFFDQSMTGRWEHTPTIMPILDRIAAIEDNTGEVVEYTSATADDLLPLAQQYRVGPGDLLRIMAYDLVTLGQPELYEVVVDSRGGIEIPQLGHFTVQGFTATEIEAVLVQAARRLVRDPLISVQAVQQRQQTFTLIGSVQAPGPYFIPKPDYRLLEAVTAGGPFNQDVEYVYVIRQVPLSEAVRGNPPAVTPGPRPGPPGTQPGGRTLDEILRDIEERQKQQNQPPAPPASDQPAPDKSVLDIIDKIAPPADKPPEKLPESPANPGGGSPGAFGYVQPPDEIRPPQPPAIDLPESAPPRPAPGAPAQQPTTSWVFLNGKWVQVTRGTGSPGEPVAPGSAADELVTQRIIRVPMNELIQGRQSVNIVIRPGDVVRIPFPPTGLIYMAGMVNRVGPIGIPAGGITLQRAIDSAGGLSGIAVPERVDLQRMVGDRRQATIRLDLRAIAEQTQPDILLKPNDRINVGTNFWAYPVAVMRNGFRASYGFGFILDRNFGNDVFGVPPGTGGGF